MSALLTVARWAAVTAAVTMFILAVFLLGYCAGRGQGEVDPGNGASGAIDTEGKKPAKKKQYACSMFCVPPVPEPGKCPVCGMDMVEVDAGETAGPGSSLRLTISDRARKLAEIQTAPVERKFVTAVIRIVGKVDFDETRRKTITSWVPGRIDRLFADYTGLEVKKGDGLVTLYSPDLISAQEELIQALRAVKELEKSNLPGVKRTARETVQAAREKLGNLGLTSEQITAVERSGKSSDRVTIHAPISGIVIHKDAMEGMYVKTGTRIYTIADLSWVWVTLDAYESDLAWLRYGQEVEFNTEAYPGTVFRGRVAFIDPVLDPRTRTVKIRVSVPNPNGRLKPDMFVRARIRSRMSAGGRVLDPSLAGKWISPRHPEIVKDGPGTCDRCGIALVRAEDLGYGLMNPEKARAPLVIPASAPLITGKRAVVYVELEHEPGTFMGREIALGPRAEDHYLVRWGLEEGEMVVVNGTFKIDSSIQIRAGRSMMNPAVEATAGKQARCPVSGNAIDSTVFIDHEGKRIYFCCSHCIKKFRNDPETYQNKMRDQGVILEDVPGNQTHCPVMGNKINKDVFSDHEGKRVYFCCPPCIKKFKDDPEIYLNKVKDLGIQLENSPEAGERK